MLAKDFEILERNMLMLTGRISLTYQNVLVILNLFMRKSTSSAAIDVDLDHHLNRTNRIESDRPRLFDLVLTSCYQTQRCCSRHAPKAGRQLSIFNVNNGQLSGIQTLPQISTYHQMKTQTVVMSSYPEIAMAPVAHECWPLSPDLLYTSTADLSTHSFESFFIQPSVHLSILLRTTPVKWSPSLSSYSLEMTIRLNLSLQI